MVHDDRGGRLFRVQLARRRQAHPDRFLYGQYPEEHLVLLHVRACGVAPRVPETPTIRKPHLLAHPAVNQLRGALCGLDAETVEEVALAVIASRVALGDELL